MNTTITPEILTYIEEMNATQKACRDARTHYLATGEGGDQVFYGVTVQLNALYFLMKQAEKAYNIEDTDETYAAFEKAQKTYYRAGGTCK